MRAGAVAVGIFAVLIVCARSARPAEAGEEAEQRSCTPCHSLRLIRSQRLSAAAWEKEVNKMIGWGAVVPDRRVLIDYLTRQYGADKAPEREELTRNGTERR